MDQRTQNGKSVSVTVLGVSSLKYPAQLLVHLGLHLKIKVREERDLEINVSVCKYGVLCEMRSPASGLCNRKATVQFSQAAVVSVPPMRRSTVAM